MSTGLQHGDKGTGAVAKVTIIQYTTGLAEKKVRPIKSARMVVSGKTARSIFGAIHFGAGASELIVSVPKNNA